MVYSVKYNSITIQDTFIYIFLELKLQLSRIKMAKVYANVLKEQSYLEQICFEHTWQIIKENVLLSALKIPMFNVWEGKIISISHGAITMHKFFTF